MFTNGDFYYYNGNTYTPTTYYGIHTDTKETNNIANGSCFIEMDTGKIYFYDATSE